MRVAFGTVMYPSALEFADDFLFSLKQQTNNKFTLVAINDGIDPIYLKNKLESYIDSYEIINVEGQKTSAELRTVLIKEIKVKKFDIVVFGDADDCFSSTRVQNIQETASKFTTTDFFYNDIKFMDGSSVMPKLPDFIDAVDSILDFNFLGLSNTALRLTNIDMPFINSLFEFKFAVYDWYLFSRLLLLGKLGIYVPDSISYYRSWEANIIGKQVRTKDSINKEIKVKLNHYNLLKEYSSQFYKRFLEYSKGNICKTDEKELYYWWNYTIGGNKNEIFRG